MSIIEEIINIVAPHPCLGCGGEGHVLCGACRSSLPVLLPRCYRCQRTDGGARTCAVCRATSPLFQVFAATEYAGVAKEVVYALKFGRAKAAARDIAASLAAILPRNDWVITYAPTAAARARTRGYDQAQLIARELAQMLQTPYAAVLARSGTQRQLGQNRARRKAQMTQAFRVVDNDAVQNKHILLIDDVLTTGATCEAAATALRAAGAWHVSAAVFAAA